MPSQAMPCLAKPCQALPATPRQAMQPGADVGC